MKHDKCHRTRNAAVVVAVVGWMKTETPGVASKKEIEMAGGSYLNVKRGSLSNFDNCMSFNGIVRMKLDGAAQLDFH